MDVSGNIASRVFSEGRLSVGIVLPVRSREASAIDFQEQVAFAKEADRLGFAAVWVRDVPLNGPWYPEDFGHPDPFVMLGAIAASTSRIALGTAATVLTLRHPLHIAKAAISLDRLSGGRLILGLGSGDRPKEFAAFGYDVADHKTLYRDHWLKLSEALRRPPKIMTAPETDSAEFELRPPPLTDIAMLSVGSSGQTLEWIARNASGWATYHREPSVQRDRYALWRRAVDRLAPDEFRSFSVALRLDLVSDRDAFEPIELGYKAGAARLAEALEELRKTGVHHVFLNLAPNGRPALEQLQEIGSLVLPSFAH